MPPPYYRRRRWFRRGRPRYILPESLRRLRNRRRGFGAPVVVRRVSEGEAPTPTRRRRGLLGRAADAVRRLARARRARRATRRNR